MFSCKIERRGHFREISIISSRKKYKYALYVFEKIKPEDTELTQVASYKYQKSNVFLHPTNGNDREISFQYFVKNEDGDCIYTSKICINDNKRDVVVAGNVDFTKSTDVDVLNNYRVPINYKKINNRKRHYIFFNGALARSISIYPSLSRNSWSKKVDSNILNIYDSSINPSDNYLLGWYHGVHNKPFQDDVIPIIESLKEKNGLSNQDLIFYGSSGGGWAALKFSSLFQGSIGVAINPQTNIIKYEIEAAVDKFLARSYPQMEKSEVLMNYSNELMIDPKGFMSKGLEKEFSERSRFILAQNILDASHYNDHFLDFWGNFSSTKNGGWDDLSHNYAIVYEHESGHGAETNDVFLRIQSVIEEMLSDAVN